MVKIELSPGRRAGRYIVTWRGEVLIASARDPEHQVARLLLARGITGTMMTRWAGSRFVAMRFDIESAARCCTRDGGGRLVVVPFEPHPRSIENGLEPRCGGWVAAPAISAADARARHQQMAIGDRSTDLEQETDMVDALSGAGCAP